MKNTLLKTSIVSAILLSSTALASEVSVPVKNQEGFNTETQAVTEAFSAVIKNNTEYEFGGGIYLLDDKYYYTSPISNNSDKEISEYKIAIPKNAKLIALFHTHPFSKTGDNSEYFSTQDIKTSTEMNLISYVCVLKNNSIIRYVPGLTPRVFLTATGAPSGAISYGTDVGKIS